MDAMDRARQNADRPGYDNRDADPLPPRAAPSSSVLLNGDGRNEPPPPPRWPPPVLVTKLVAGGADVDFLWHGCLARGHLTMLSALAKGGKTTFLGHLLRALQSGEPFVGLPTKKCRTLIVSEESAALWCRRRDLLGLDDQLAVMCRPMVAKPNFGDWSEFIAEVHGHAADLGSDLIAIDTLTAFAPWKSENDSAEVQGTLTPLNRLTNDRRAVLLFHHFGKTDGSEGRASRGSTALVAAVDIVLEMRRHKAGDENDRRRVLAGRGRFDEVPHELIIRLDEDGTGYTAEGERRAIAARELAAAIVDTLPTGIPGLRADELHERLPADVRPQRSRLTTVLTEGLDAGQWQATGTGKKGDPRRFYRVES